jgi:hypothetical protein
MPIFTALATAETNIKNVAYTSMIDWNEYADLVMNNLETAGVDMKTGTSEFSKMLMAYQYGNFATQKLRFNDDAFTNGSTEPSRDAVINDFNDKINGFDMEQVTTINGIYNRVDLLKLLLLEELNEMTGVGTTSTIEGEYNIAVIRDINKQLLNQIADLGEWQALVKDINDIGFDSLIVAGTLSNATGYDDLASLGTQQKAMHLLDGGFNPQYLAQQPTVGKKQDGVEIA